MLKPHTILISRYCTKTPLKVREKLQYYCALGCEKDLHTPRSGSKFHFRPALKGGSLQSWRVRKENDARRSPNGSSPIKPTRHYHAFTRNSIELFFWMNANATIMEWWTKGKYCSWLNKWPNVPSGGIKNQFIPERGGTLYAVLEKSGGDGPGEPEAWTTVLTTGLSWRNSSRPAGLRWT